LLGDLLSKIGGELTYENSFLSPVVRNYYLQGYRKVLPANTPDGKVRGVLFCHPETGEVRHYLFSVHFGRTTRDGVFFVVKNYLDFLAVSALSDELNFVPVLTSGPIGLTTLIWNLEGLKVDKPDYERYVVIPVEEKRGLWRLYSESPSSFEERLLELIREAEEIDDVIDQLRSSL